MLLSFGKAPCLLALIAVACGLLTWLGRPSAGRSRPDLVLAVFSKEHRAAYEPIIATFEREHHVRVQVQLMEIMALQSRLRAAMQSGADVPDVVELIEPSIGVFTRGSLSDIGLVDLSERIRAAGLRDRLVAGRFALWESRDRCFAIPHDVHPMALVYRRDLVEALGIDLARLDTWDHLLEAGRGLARGRRSDGTLDRYLIDLPDDGGWGLQALLRQRGGEIIDAAGAVRFDDPAVIDTVLWYLRATHGPQRIAFSAGWGQSLAKAMLDGVAVFYLAPDWRTRQFELDVPQLAGKLGAIPLPAWEPGGRRTSTAGGTGIAITRACPRPDLAWALIEALYLEPAGAGARFAASNILPPVRAAWAAPEIHAPDAFFGGQPIGELYAELAPAVPAVHVSAYEEIARAKLTEAFLAAAAAYEADGENGIRERIAGELRRCADDVRRAIAHDRLSRLPDGGP